MTAGHFGVDASCVRPCMLESMCLGPAEVAPGRVVGIHRLEKSEGNDRGAAGADLCWGGWFAGKRKRRHMLCGGGGGGGEGGGVGVGGGGGGVCGGGVGGGGVLERGYVQLRGRKLSKPWAGLEDQRTFVVLESSNKKKEKSGVRGGGVTEKASCDCDQPALWGKSKPE